MRSDCLIAKVGKNFVAAQSQSELDRAVADVKAGIPMIGSTMRVRGTEVTGGVRMIDTALEYP